MNLKHVHILENICITDDLSHPPATHPQLIRMYFLLHDPPDPRIQPPFTHHYWKHSLEGYFNQQWIISHHYSPRIPPSWFFLCETLKVKRSVAINTQWHRNKILCQLRDCFSFASIMFPHLSSLSLHKNKCNTFANTSFYYSQSDFLPISSA